MRKKMRRILGFSVSSLAILAMVMSCQKIDLGEGQGDGSSVDGLCKVKITSKSGETGVSIPRPFTIYVVGSDNSIVEHRSVDSPEEGFSLSLMQNTYSFSAVAGATEVTGAKAGVRCQVQGATEVQGVTEGATIVSADNATQSIISLGNGFSSSPVMLATRSGDVITKDATLKLTLQYAVAAFDLTLMEIPADISRVEVVLSKQYEALSIMNVGSGSMDVVLPLTKQEDGSWITGVRYVLPGAATNTVLTVRHYAGEEERKSYSVTYPYPLKAGTPYHFTGTYNGAGKLASLSCEVGTREWGADVPWSFNYADESGEVSLVDDDTYEVTKVPEAGTIWNGHLLALVESAEGSVSEGLLVSLKEWGSMKASADAIQNYRDGYEENGVKGWVVPTKEQAQSLVARYFGGNISKINTPLLSVSGTKLTLSDTPAYFYGDDAKNVFSFYKETLKTDTTTTSKSSYKLRLVKVVKFKAP